MNWISINDRLPEIPADAPSYARQVRVIVCWGESWAEMKYVRKEIRGKTVERFEWLGRINTFPIAYWAIPDLPKMEK